MLSEQLKAYKAQGEFQESKHSSIASLGAPHLLLTQPAFLEGSALGRMACVAHKVYIHTAHLCYTHPGLNNMKHAAQTVKADVFLWKTGTF